MILKNKVILQQWVAGSTQATGEAFVDGLEGGKFQAPARIQQHQIPIRPPSIRTGPLQGSYTPPELKLMSCNAEGKASLSANIRCRWSSDPVYGPEWVAELRKCDELCTGERQDAAAVASVATTVAPIAGSDGGVPVLVALLMLEMEGLCQRNGRHKVMGCWKHSQRTPAAPTFRGSR